MAVFNLTCKFPPVYSFFFCFSQNKDGDHLRLNGFTVLTFVKEFWLLWTREYACFHLSVVTNVITCWVEQKHLKPSPIIIVKFINLITANKLVYLHTYNYISLLFRGSCSISTRIMSIFCNCRYRFWRLFFLPSFLHWYLCVLGTRTTTLFLWLPLGDSSTQEWIVETKHKL